MPWIEFPVYTTTDTDRVHGIPRVNCSREGGMSRLLRSDDGLKKKALAGENMIDPDNWPFCPSLSSVTEPEHRGMIMMIALNLNLKE